MYIIDTCSLTTLYRVYPNDVFGRVWSHVESLIDSGVLISSIEVLLELEAVEDRLLEWARLQNLKGIFNELDSRVQQLAKEILKTHGNLLDFRKRKSSGDVFVIALAMSRGYAVVTEEQHSGGPQKSKIPDVCDYYSIKCINLIQMLRETKLSI